MCLWKIQKKLQRIICDRCGVEVTEKKVRRESRSHQSCCANCSYLVFPFPNKIGYILGLPSKKLDMIIYYERYVVIQAGIAKMVKVNLVKIRFLTEEEYLNILDTLPADNQYLMILIQINLLPKWEQSVLWIY
jgi:DNA-directed RNA polymerase subunit beta'